MRYFIDAVTTGKPVHMLTVAALLFLGAALLQQVISVTATYVGEKVAWKATNALREDLTTHCLQMDMGFHNDRSPGEFVERIEGDASEFSNFFSQLVLGVIGNFLLLIGILIALANVNWLLGLSFTLYSIITLLVLNRVREIAVPHQKAQRDAETELFGFLEERLAGTEDIRSSGAVDYVICKLYKLQTTILNLWLKTQKTLVIFVNAPTGFLLTAGMGLSFIMGYNFYGKGMLSLGTVFLIVNYTQAIARPIRELSQKIENMQNIGATIERMGELLANKSSIVEGNEIFDKQNEPLALSFDEVSFEYAENKPVLKDLSFSVEPGQVLGLLGRTGVGKTTLARLIFRLYDPVKGCICLGNHEHTIWFI